jgi:hypothetical protein
MLQRRLKRLESIDAASGAARAYSDAAMADAARAIAAREIFAALELAFPSDSWSAGTARQSSPDKIDAAAARLAAGAATDDDLAGFASLPAKAVAVFGAATGLEFAGALAAWPERWSGRAQQPRFVASAAPDAATTPDASPTASRSPADDQPRAQHRTHP